MIFFSCPEVNTKSPIPNFWFMIPLLGMRNFHHPQTVYQVGPVLQIAPITSNNYGLWYPKHSETILLNGVSKRTYSWGPTLYGIVDPKHISNIGLVNIMSLGGCCNPLRKGMKICLFIGSPRIRWRIKPYFKPPLSPLSAARCFGRRKQPYSLQNATAHPGKLSS